MECECIVAIATVFGVIITFTGIYFGLKQYKNENRFKKAAQFFELRVRFKENEKFNKIRDKLNNNQNLNDINQTDIYDYAGFFEELQIAINSGFIDPEMVYYLFGYYIIQFADKQEKISLDLPLWAALNELASNMKYIRSKPFRYSKKLKF